MLSKSGISYIGLPCTYLTYLYATVALIYTVQLSQYYHFIHLKLLMYYNRCIYDVSHVNKMLALLPHLYNLLLTCFLLQLATSKLCSLVKADNIVDINVSFSVAYSGDQHTSFTVVMTQWILRLAYRYSIFCFLYQIIPGTVVRINQPIQLSPFLLIY